MTDLPLDQIKDLEALKFIGKVMGYRFETDADGTERVYRPDGTLAITARKKVAAP